jgi:hypothetical protein
LFSFHEIVSVFALSYKENTTHDVQKFNARGVKRALWPANAFIFFGIREVTHSHDKNVRFGGDLGIKKCPFSLKIGDFGGLEKKA